jgi:ornithine carbamoyltransferase
MELKKLSKSLSEFENTLYNKDFLLTWEKSDDELQLILNLAQLIKDTREQNISMRAFESGLAVSMFRDKSTRTRFRLLRPATCLGSPFRIWMRKSRSYRTAKPPAKRPV